MNCTTGCDKPAIAHGLCVRCYSTWRRGKEPAPAAPPVKAEVVLGVGVEKKLAMQVDRACKGNRSAWLRQAITEKLFHDASTRKGPADG